MEEKSGHATTSNDTSNDTSNATEEEKRKHVDDATGKTSMACSSTSKKHHPIGPGYMEPMKPPEDQKHLDHTVEEEQKEALMKASGVLNSREMFKGLEVVELTAAPDEDANEGLTASERETDPRTKASLSTPVIAYPEMLLKKEYNTHDGAGKGTSWISSEDRRGSAMNQSSQSAQGIALRQNNEVLPRGFLKAISHTHTASQHVDYLPSIPNLPQSKAVGRIKPRSAADDWLSVGFDPWSAGREPLSAEFIPALTIKQEDLLEPDTTAIVPESRAFIEEKDEAGHTEMAVVSAEEAKLAQDFQMLCSWARHGRYQDVDTAMSQSDWLMPIDYVNEQGITLLHVGAQNGNKRIIKLCLRKGAEVNKQNHNGQTALHYAHAYGFKELADYLVSKGADDSIVNADGLTCYEGLSAEELTKL
ncbi:unnamed protein product [Chrysoparadoxa australica]